MSLRIFADHCTSNLMMETLRQSGHLVFRLKDYIPQDSPDDVAIAKAQELNSIMLSLNGDFSDIVTYPPENYQGIIALQVRNHPEIIPQIMARLVNYLSAHPEMGHYAGKLLLVEVHRIRVRE